MNKNLLLFTVDFPYGNYEISFLPQEINVLSAYFNKIYLIPLKIEGQDPLVKLPENVEVIFPGDSGRKKNIKDTLFAISVFLREVIETKNFRLLRNFKYHLSELLNYQKKASDLNDLLEEKKISSADSIFYTYWFDEWTSILSLVQKKYSKNIKLITRAHGFDLYDYRSLQGYIFPRSLQMKYIDSVYAISKDGTRYLESKFPGAKNKIHTSRLGITKTHSQELLNNAGESIVITSCSAVIGLKRVHKIVEILLNSKKKIHWIHFGDGPLMDALKESAKKLPHNVTVDFKGNVNNNLIKEFYSKNHIDWFMNVSEYEGIPVSIMEAISFGIPVIATNVGGVKEIVTDSTGILIDKEFDPSHVISLIENKLFSNAQKNTIVDFWKKNYDAETNFTAFAKELINTQIKPAH